MKKFLIVLASALAMAIAVVPVAHAQAPSDEVLLKEVYTLLVENRAAAAAIAASMGIASSNVLPQPGSSQADINNVLMVRNQHLFKQIAIKLGADVATPIPTAGTIVEQNHQILRGNRMVTKSILLALGLDTSAPLSLKGSLVEQNRDLLLGNKAALKAIADKLGLK